MNDFTCRACGKTCYSAAELENHVNKNCPYCGANMRSGGMKLSEQCKTCKANWEGHCINGNDIWKSRMSNIEVKCEDYKEREDDNHDM